MEEGRGQVTEDAQTEERQPLAAHFARWCEVPAVGEEILEPLVMPTGLRVVDKDGDPWLVTHNGMQMFPDDPDRRVWWATQNVPQAESLYGPFRVADQPKSV